MKVMMDSNITGIEPSVWKVMWEAAHAGHDMVHFLDSMSPNQLESKIWLVEQLESHVEYNDDLKVQLYGGWFGYPITNILLQSSLDIRAIQNIDLDEKALKVFRQYSSFDNSDVNFVATHKSVMDKDERDWGTNIVINTSSEHMPDMSEIIKNKEYKTKEDNTKSGPPLFAVQSNNMHHISDHINCVTTRWELEDKCGFSDIRYSGKIKMHNGYERYMVIGYA